MFIELNPYRIEVDWAPVHELFVSLWAYVTRREHKTLDLGPPWVRGVREMLRPDLAAQLSSIRALEPLDGVGFLIGQCPDERDAAGFIDWLSGLSAGELYERIAPLIPEGKGDMLQGLDAARDSAVRLLSAWNEQYFSGIAPAILDGLRRDAEAARALVGTIPSVELVERATNGLDFVPAVPVEYVLLTPQYHYRPWNLFGRGRDMWFFQYPTDAPPTVEGEPPSRLLRLARALSDESRLRILHHLTAGPCSFTDLVRLTGLSKSTVHHHMVALRAAGLVRVHFVDERRETYSLRTNAADALGENLRRFLHAS